MAKDFGIASISGCPIANVGKRSNVVKSNIWSISEQQRQSSLFRSLNNAGTRIYEQGKNSASFKVQGEGARVYFLFDGNRVNTDYTFSFVVSGITRNGWTCALSSTTAFENDTINATPFNTNGNQTIVVNSRSSYTNRNLYIGIWNLSTGGNRDEIIVSNLLVNI